MQKDYRQIYLLLEQTGPWYPRLERIHKIIRQPSFQYRQAEAADMISDIFMKSSYWLDQELFDDSYLYKPPKNLLPFQRIHLKMVDIGVTLLNKGFPLCYAPSNYQEKGPSQLSPYVKTFIEQCHKKRNFLHQSRLFQKHIAKTNSL